MSNVQVAVRVRPMNDREKAMGSKCIIEMDGQTTTIRNPAIEGPAGIKTFSFDYSYWSTDQSNKKNWADQLTVFSDMGVSILNNAFEGYNCSIFAYGQTGSGKSHSIIGYGADKGLIPRVCEEMFVRINDMTAKDPKLGFTVEVSFMEIYNEQINDLLNAATNRKGGLKVRNHPVTGPYVEDLAKMAVSSYKEIEDLMDEGSKSRTVAATNMNATSSRSHAVFTIMLTQKKEEGSIVSKIHMVDLAGSERANATGATGARLKEGANINKSLSTLGKVISALAKRADGKSNVFVPYRDSVLTWLLREALGGNSKTMMLAALSPADVNFEETLSTLRYADSAKQIKNSAVINEDPTQKLIRELQEEVERLKHLLEEKGVAPESITSPRAGASSNSYDTAENHDSTDSAEPKDNVADIKSQLSQTQKLMNDLNKTWSDRVQETQRIQRQRALEFQDMGIAMEAASQLPKLVNLNEDPILSGALVYYLVPGETTVGKFTRDDESEDGHTVHPGRIRLAGLGVAIEHCVINHRDDGEVWLEPKDGLVYVNGKKITDHKRLKHGSRVIIGTNHVFRFNHPEEATRAIEDEEDETIRAETGGKIIDYNFALAEKAASEVDTLMANSMKFNITTDDEKQLEAKLKELYDKKVAEKEVIKKQIADLRHDFDTQLAELDAKQKGGEDVTKQRDDVKLEYDRKKQELNASDQILSYVIKRQKEKFASFSFRIITEKSERQHLKEKIMQAIVLIDEANAIAEALQKAIKVELFLQSNFPQLAGLDDEDLEEAFGRFKNIKVCIRLVDKSTRQQQTASFEEFADKVADMRSLYQQFVSGSLPIDSISSAEGSPFYVSVQQERVIGFAHVYLKDLLYLGKSERDVAVFDYEGYTHGSVHAALSRTHDTVPSTPSKRKPRGRAATDTPEVSPDASATAVPNGAEAEEFLQGDELIGANLSIGIKIDSIRGLLPETYRDVFYRFKWYKDSKATKSDLGTPGLGDSFTFGNEHKFTVSSVGEEFLTYLDSDAIAVEIWASENSAVTAAQPANGTNGEALTDEFKLLVTMSIQELEGKEYKNVAVKEEPWGDPAVIFRLNKGRKAPRKVIFAFAHIKDRGLEIEGCESATIGNFHIPSPTATSTTQDNAHTEKPKVVEDAPISLKIIGADRDKIELEWDWASNENLTAALLPAAVSVRRSNSRNKKLDSAPDSPGGQTPEKEEPRLNADVTLTLRLGGITQPVKFTKPIGFKLYVQQRSLSRTESEQHLMDTLKVMDTLKTEDERRAMAGCHFSVSILRSRELKERITAVIQQQQAYQKLLGASLMKEKLKQEIELHDKLQSPPSSPRALRPREQLTKQLQGVMQRSPSRNTVLKDHVSDSIISVKVVDLTHRMESKMSGFLNKKAGKQWKRRWFVLSRTFLSLFENETADTPKSSMDLTNATITEVPPTQYPHAFVAVNWQNVWFLQAESADEYAKWLDALNPLKKLKESHESSEQQLKVRLETTKQAVADQTEQIKILKKQVLEANETIRMREDEIVQYGAELEQVHKSYRDKLEEAKNVKPAVDESALNAVKAEAEALKAAVAAKEKESKVSAEALAEVEAELAATKEKLKQVASNSDAQDELNDEIAKLKREVARYKESAEDSQNDLADVKNNYKQSLSALEKQIVTLQDKLAESEEKAKNSARDTSRNDRAAADFESAKEELEAKDKALSASKRQVQELTSKLDKLEDELDTLQRDLKRTKDKFQRQEAELQEKSAALDKLEKDFAEKDRELSRLQRSAAAGVASPMTASASSANSYSRYSRSDSSSLRSESPASSNRYSTSSYNTDSESVQQLRRQLAEKQELIESLEDRSTGGSDRLVSKLSKAQDKVTDLEREKSDLEKELDRVKKDLKTKERELKYPAVTNAVRQAELTTLKAVVEDRDTKSQGLKDKIKDLQKELREATRDIDAKDRAVFNAQKDRAELERKVKSLQAQVADDAKRRQDAEKAERDTRQKLEAAEEKANHLQTTIAKLQSQLDDLPSSGADASASASAATSGRRRRGSDSD